MVLYALSISKKSALVIFIVLLIILLLISKGYAYNNIIVNKPTITHSQKTEDNTDEDRLLEDLIEIIVSLDKEALNSFAELIGLTIDDDNEAIVKSKIIQIIKETFKLIHPIDKTENRISILIPLSEDKLSVECDRYLIRDVVKGDISYTQYIFFSSRVYLNEYEVSTDLLVMNKTISDKDTNPKIRLMAAGDSRLKVDNYIFQSERVFIYPDSMRVLLYDVRAYFPELLPFIVTSEEVKVMSDKEIILTNAILSSDANPLFPHYQVFIGTIWLYPELDDFSLENIFASNLTFQIGQTKLLYLPFFFQTGFSTGIHISIRYEQSIGFYLQTTTPFKIFGYSNSLIFDYYQKMGLYVSFVESISPLPYLDIQLSLAYDRAVRYIGISAGHWGELSNYVDIDNDGIENETFNSLRYYLSVEMPLTFYKGEAVNLERGIKKYCELSFLDILYALKPQTFSEWWRLFISNAVTGFNFDGYIISDPLFKEQFIEFPREDVFKFQENIIYKEDNIAIYTPDSPGSSTNGLDLSGVLYFTTIGIDIGLSIDALWSFRSRTGKLNPYDVLNYYALQPRSVTFPNFWIDTHNTLSDNLIDDIIRLGYIIFNPDKPFKSLSEIVPGLELTLPIKYKFRLQTTTKWTFVEGDSEIKPADDTQTNTNIGEVEQNRTIEKTTFSYSLPLLFSYRFIKYTLRTDYELIYTYYHTRTDIDSTEEEMLDKDRKETRFSWEWVLYSLLAFDFLANYEYLNLKFGISLSYEKSGEFDDLFFQIGFKDTENGESKFINPGETLEIEEIYFTFFKSTLSLTGLNFPLSLTDEEKRDIGQVITYTSSDNETIYHIIDEDYLLEKKKNKHLNLLLTTELIENLSLSMNYIETRRLDYQDYAEGGRDEVLAKYVYPSLFGGKGESISFIAEYKNDLEHLLFNEVLIRDIRFNIELNHFFKHSKMHNDNLSLGVSLDFDITTLWSISLSYEVENRNIYRYFKHSDNPHPVNIFQDLWWAFSFWDADSLQKTFWKMKHLYFSINHDLAEWRMIFTIDLAPRMFNDEFVVFQPTFIFTVKLIDFPDYSGGLEGDGKIKSFIYDRF